MLLACMVVMARLTGFECPTANRFGTNRDGFHDQVFFELAPDFPSESAATEVWVVVQRRP
jgi:hypothetical protein